MHKIRKQFLFFLLLAILVALFCLVVEIKNQKNVFSEIASLTRRELPKFPAVEKEIGGIIEQEGQCKVTGCNNELCVDKNINESFSNCKPDAKYQCLKTPFAVCKINAQNKCAWEYSSQYKYCSANSKPVETLRVIEVRYFPYGPGASVYNPDNLSVDLINYIKDASTPQKFANTSGHNYVDVTVVDRININTARPNIDNNWYTTYKKILSDNNLCTRIKKDDLDQVWLWVDPRTGYDTGPGLEYVVSNKYLKTGTTYISVPPEPFCNGEVDFIFMGFDMSRTADQALHSTAHLMEGLISNLQEIELFWNRFTGDGTSTFTRTLRCGNVHFPPNATGDYQYYNTNYVNSACEDWNPDSTGTTQYFNCSKWNCTHEGYLKWWFQNFPAYGNTILYKNKQLPAWWDFFVNLTEKIEYYYTHTEFFLNRELLDLNVPPITPTPTPTPSPTPTPIITPPGECTDNGGYTTNVFIPQYFRPAGCEYARWRYEHQNSNCATTLMEIESERAGSFGLWNCFDFTEIEGKILALQQPYGSTEVIPVIIDQDLLTVLSGGFRQFPERIINQYGWIYGYNVIVDAILELGYP